MNTFTRVAVATTIVASGSVCLYALSQPASISRADDAPTAPTVQQYTTPDATPAPVSRDAATTVAPTPAPAPAVQTPSVEAPASQPVTATPACIPPMLTAEDGTCVGPDYYGEPQPETPQPAPECVRNNMAGPPVSWLCLDSDKYGPMALNGQGINLPACATEDSDNCYWYAPARGNGQGRSFIVINGLHFYAN